MNYRIYEDEGTWVLWDRDTDYKAVFTTQQEANMVIGKIQFVEALRAQATAIAQAGAALDDMAEVYVDREYDSTNPFTAEDLAPLGLTVEQVTAMIAIVPDFLTFVNTAANRAALNDMRTDL